MFGPDYIWCKTTMQIFDELFETFPSNAVDWAYGLTWGKLKQQVQTLRTCWEAELKTHLFLDELDHADYYQNPIGPWKSIVMKFGCGDDVEEGRRCIALGRFTASVFHMLRTVEYGVLALQSFLGEADPKAHFGSVVGKLEGMVQKTKYEHLDSDMREKLPFLRSVLPQLHAVKDAWRDKVAHADLKINTSAMFTKDKAIEIHNVSFALMKNLSENLNT
jgi:hypothetical protein